MKKKSDIFREILKIFLNILCILFTVIGFLSYFSAIWCDIKYGKVGFDAILFTLSSDLSGTAGDLVFSYIWNALVPALVCSAIILIPLLFRSKKKIVAELFGKLRIRIFPFRSWVSAIIALVLCVVLVNDGAQRVELSDYISSILHQGAVYDNEYIDPKNIEIVFPEKKRNLIYIYLESMETTFLSGEQGGALPYNVIPELYELAGDNINFSQNEGIGGCPQINGATWTVGAMVAQSAGIPLKLPNAIDNNDYGMYAEFLPGVSTIYDILKENGYNQSLIIGSNSNYGGRKQYFSQHGTDNIYDYLTAAEEGFIDKDYFVWWGMEDLYMFDYAKQKLTEIAKGDQPFAVTMLTADTHSFDGYVCELCDTEYYEQYENVYACSSRQTAEFIKWLSEQDFYDDTTVILVGDHCSMDAEYMTRNNIGEDYTRRIYNCFINSAVEPVKEKNRDFTQFDMFPSTLAAMGCKIEGNRLGLGVNLFSNEDTLSEKYGFDWLDTEVAKKSAMYDTKFLLGKSK